MWAAFERGQRALAGDGASALVAEYLDPYVTMLRNLADALAAAMPDAPHPRLLRAAIGHALAFPTWRSLALDQGPTDPEAVAMMTVLVQPAALTIGIYGNVRPRNG